ncbi:MAG: hypothetical protein AAGH79_16570 [Bacteroidota bacterium]
MKPRLSLFFLFFALALSGQDYRLYHERVIAAEQEIVMEQYAEALALYELLLAEYDFIFLRDIQYFVT